MERAGHIRLPQRRRKSTNGFRNRNAPLVAHATAPIRRALRELRPLAVSVVDPHSEDPRLFNCLLGRYHYLGHCNSVGENIRYLVRDRVPSGRGRPAGCALFGSAAWKCAARDAWIGWDRGTREANLGLLTNNTRFLVLPWVAVPHLASHMLAGFARPLRADWPAERLRFTKSLPPARPPRPEAQGVSCQTEQSTARLDEDESRSAGRTANMGGTARWVRKLLVRKEMEGDRDSALEAVCINSPLSQSGLPLRKRIGLG